MENIRSKSIAEYSDQELLAEKSRINHSARIKEKKPTANLQTVSDIQRESIKWLWPDRIALRKFSLIAGDPGLGKSLITIDLAARISEGRPFPDNSPCPTGHTVLLTAEDDPADTIRPRLEAAFANVEKIHIIRGKNINKRTGIEKKTEILLSEIDVIRDSLDQIRGKEGNPLMLVIDPIDAFLGVTDSHRNSEVRGLLSPLAEFAAAEEIAVLGIMHLNKSANSPAYRIGGSIGFTAAARSVWITAKSKEDPSRRLFLPLKNNLAADADGLTYFIVPDDAEGIPIVRWAEPAEEDLNEALRQETGYRKKRTSPERDQIVDILKESGEPLSAKDIAEQLGKNRSTVRNLLAKMRNDGAVHCPVYGVYAPGDIDTVDTVDSRQE